jgi:hypothetical protein
MGIILVFSPSPPILVPMGLRFDACGVLRHVLARGIEHPCIFQDATDYKDFVRARRGVATTGHGVVHARVMLPNHFHLRVRTGTRPLAGSIRLFPPGYGGTFRRHRRPGHLFQNCHPSPSTGAARKVPSTSWSARS